MNRQRFLVGCLLGLGLVTTALRAGPSVGGDFSLEGGLTSRSNGQATEGDFTVAATVGETSPEPSTGGDFGVIGGLVSVTVVAVEGAFALTVGLTLDGQVRIEWPAEATGYVLEFTPQLGESVNWQPVTPAPAGNVHTTPNDQSRHFFRLRRP